MTFRPDSRHKLYKKRIKQYKRQRDVIEGEDAIKAEGRKYLPALDGQLESRSMPANEKIAVIPYESYKNRAVFINATARTVEALSGAILRKEPKLEVPSQMDELLNIVGREYETFEELVGTTVDEVIGIGRYGQLVDMDEFGREDPYVCEYHAENITDWKLGNVGGRQKPVRIHLREDREIETGEGETRIMDRYRILWLGFPLPDMDEEGNVIDDFGVTEQDLQNGLFYYQEVWDEVSKGDHSSGGKKDFVKTATIIPRPQGGGVFNEIPFTFFNSITTKAKPTKPALSDVAVINVSLYVNSADLEHGLHFSALPQPWAAGFDFNGPVSIGSTTVWVTDQPNATAGYLEFSGQGLGAIRETMREKKKEMAALAAKILEEAPEAGGNEAAETLKIRHRGENSILARIAKSTSIGLTQTLKFLARFKRIDESNIKLRLNSDFGAGGISPQMLTAILAGVQAGQVSPETLFHNMQKGELHEEGLTFAQEQARIIASGNGFDDEIDPPSPPGDEQPTNDE